MRTLDDRAMRLFIALAAFFCVNAVLAEFIGVKIFTFEDTPGIDPLEWNLFGQTGSLSFTAGTLLWPMVFILTGVINEFFGKRGVKFISWLAATLNGSVSNSFCRQKRCSLDLRKPSPPCMLPSSI